MTEFERALVEFSTGPRQALADAHLAAIATGGRFTGSDYESERACTAQDLLCMASQTVFELALIAQVYDAAGPVGENAAALGGVAGAVARLSARALEVHARDTGYDAAIWINTAVEETEITILDDGDPLFDGFAGEGKAVFLARQACGGINAALACLPADRMGVPGHLAAALGSAVALYMLADDAEDDG